MQALRSGDVDMAIRLADRLAADNPARKEAVLWSVQVRLIARRWSDAVSVGKQSFAASRSPELAGLIGHGCEALGLYADAQGWFEIAADAQPECAVWHFHRAASLLELRRQYEAMLSLRLGVELVKEPSAILQLADLEMLFDGAEEAMALAASILAANPRDPGANSTVARALMQLGRPEEADAYWATALAPTKTSDQVAKVRAKSLIQYGFLDRAAKEAAIRIADRPEEPDGYVQCCLARKLVEQDRPLVARMEELAASPSADEEVAASLEYALGKAYDNLHEYSAAMTHYDKANQIAGRKIERLGGFRREGYAANMALRREAFNRDAIRQVAESGQTTDIPIFVVGMMRSGTTLAEQILSAHPSVHGAGELEHWLAVDGELIDPTRAIAVDALRKHASIYYQILLRFCKTGTHVVDKQPGNLLVVGALHAAFPNARIVHMRRNPLDTVLSIWTTPMTTSAMFVNDKSNIVFAYREYQSLMDHWRSVVPADRFLDVDYESLVSNREPETRRLLDFCGLPWDEACLTPELNTKSVATPSLWQVRQPVYRTSIDRWRNYEPWLGEFRELLPQSSSAR